MPDSLPDRDFELYSKLIYDQSGIHFSVTNRSILESRLRERLREKKMDDFSSYYRLIVSDPEEMKVLLDSVTTNLTRFFRNTAHFEAFENFVVPETMAEKRNSEDRKIRIWSAGCSTGEEPYTIGMILLEILPKPWKAEIIASDISLRSLMVGKEGFYQEPRMQGVPETYLRKYFEKKGGGYQVCQAVKDMVRFDYHNLRFDSGTRGLDIVFCRNVLIYFDEAAQKATVERFWEAMAPRSYLFIGHSESLFGMNTRFEFVKTEWACFYRKNAGGGRA